MASGERFGFTSRKVVPTRAVENHVCVVYCNPPSAPVPEETADSGSRTVAVPVAHDTVPVLYSGGTTVCGPNGDAMISLPVYPTAPHLAPGDAVHLVHGNDCFDAAATASIHAALSIAGLTWSGMIMSSKPPASGATSPPQLALPRLGAVMPPDASDACVVVARYTPAHVGYVADEERNPYLADRRADLFELARGWR